VTRLGFLLDSDACIGCHACTVACKSEHDVPLGVNRTWVKYIESGSFPNVSRHFSVMRCNQCDDAPCMSICPTNALFRADNGVVDFNDGNCIGCKGCMNACPYDALYINPATNTAQKCNFCNHRIEQNLEPSCVVVCPTNAIKVADLDDPFNMATSIIAREDVSVRSPEQGTNPKVFYKGADQASLNPLRTAIPNDGMIWADTTPQHPTVPVDAPGVVARTTYTTPHEMTWKAKVSGYLVTKAIAAGVMLVAALFVLMGHSNEQASVEIAPPMVAGAFLALTGVLLITDLKQPKRFHYLITKGSWESWLVKGAYILGGFAVLLAAWWIAGLAEMHRSIEFLAIPTAIFAAATAGYTAFLFGQCEGRDLWQTPLLLPTLLAQTVTAGGATYAIIDLFMDVPSSAPIQWTFLGGVIATLSLVWVEYSAKGTPHVEAAMHHMTKGKYARRFQLGVGGLLVAGGQLIVTLATDAHSVVPAIAGLIAIAALWSYEDAFVRAGQSVPLS
jgi:Fe-S-cluster-containing dehydrogenase component/formate-dependent nitrite reductase membrane component NrfD